MLKSCAQVAFVTLISLSASTAAPPETGPNDRQITLQVGTQTRTCLLHVPPSDSAARPMPLLITFHGSGGTGKAMASMTGFSGLADKHQFVAAYPDGIVGKTRAWNSLFGKPIPGGHGVQLDDVDDVGFIRALIDHIKSSCPIDPSRIFVCGHSSGAYMAYRAALDLSDRIAAAGVVNGLIGMRLLDGKPSVAEIPPPKSPVSIIHICGGKDRLVKFEGARSERVLAMSVPDCIQHFVKANSCATPGKETRDSEHAVTRTRYTAGKGGTEVELVLVENCNHNWPFPQTGLSASLELWDFFSKHPKAATR